MALDMLFVNNYSEDRKIEDVLNLICLRELLQEFNSSDTTNIKYLNVFLHSFFLTTDDSSPKHKYIKLKEIRYEI